MLGRISLVASLMAMCTALSVLAAEKTETFRIWTAVSGTKITAKLVGKSPTYATFEKTDGARVRIPIARLSTADRDYLKGRASAQPTQPSTAVPESKTPGSAPTVKEFMNLTRTSCLRCHRKACASLDTLLQHRWVRPGNPKQSPMYKVIGKNRRQGGTYHNLTPSQKQLVHDFIANYKPTADAQP